MNSRSAVGVAFVSPDLLHAKQGTGLHQLHRFGLVSTSYIKSGHLLRLPAGAAEADVSQHFFTNGLSSPRPRK